MTNKLNKLIIDKLNESQGSFCEKVGISRQTLYNILNKKGYQPRLITIKRICNYFKVDFHNYI